MTTPTTSVETTFVDVAGKKTQLTSGGTGSPLVYLHSAAGEADWLPCHEALAAKHTVHVPAHPGFALSDGLDQIDDVQDMAWHYVDLFESQGWSGVPVVGFSLGGWLAAQLAILRPDLVSQLVLVSAAGLHVDGAPMAELFIDDLDDLRRLLFHDPSHPSVAAALPQGPEDERMLLWLRAREATARVGWNPYLHDPKLPQHLRRIQCPTLVLWGRHDKLIPLAHGEHYAAAIDGARLEVVEQCGHMLPFEQTDEFARQVLSFV